MANMFFIIPRFNMKYISKPELSLILMNSLIVSKVYFYYIMMEWWIDGLMVQGFGFSINFIVYHY